MFPSFSGVRNRAVIISDYEPVELLHPSPAAAAGPAQHWGCGGGAEEGRRAKEGWQEGRQAQGTPEGC